MPSPLLVVRHDAGEVPHETKEGPSPSREGFRTTPWSGGRHSRCFSRNRCPANTGARLMPIPDPRSFSYSVTKPPESRPPASRLTASSSVSGTGFGSAALVSGRTNTPILLSGMSSKRPGSEANSSTAGLGKYWTRLWLRERKGRSPVESAGRVPHLQHRSGLLARSARGRIRRCSRPGSTRLPTVVLDLPLS